ncbi:hypothetical protein NMG60_11021562 [Bertholletia excelsa]
MHQYSVKVVTKISSPARRSNICWRGKSFTASVPSDVPKVQKVRKRFSKDERKAMVESFVKMYRAMNEGKFPTISGARKQVGGSYYVIRSILQELEYKAVKSSTNTGNEKALGKKVATVYEASADIGEISNIQLRMDRGTHKDARIIANINRDIGASSPKHVEPQKEGETTTIFEKTWRDEVTEPEQNDSSAHVEKLRLISKDEAKVNPVQCPDEAVHDMKERLPSEDGLGLEDPNSKIEQRQLSPELENIAMDLSEKQTDDNQEPQKKSSMWENFKSFASGFISIWKKR